MEATILETALSQGIWAARRTAVSWYEPPQLTVCFICLNFYLLRCCQPP